MKHLEHFFGAKLKYIIRLLRVVHFRKAESFPPRLYFIDTRIIKLMKCNNVQNNLNENFIIQPPLSPPDSLFEDNTYL